MRTPDDIFEEFASRREGIITALTHEQQAFWKAADPDAQNLSLYGNPDGSWSVTPPAEEVPPETPEPALGINFARDGMDRKDWLCLVAVHSDTWLLSMAFYAGARLNREGRERLFELINDLPTVYEIVSGKASASGMREVHGSVGRPKKRGAPGQPLVARPPAPAPAAGGAKPQRQAAAARKRYRDEYASGDETEDEAEAAADGYADGEGEPCPNCGRLYRSGDFWIACDFCDTWYDGKCVQMTAQKAERMGKWRCPACDRRQNGY